MVTCGQQKPWIVPKSLGQNRMWQRRPRPCGKADVSAVKTLDPWVKPYLNVYCD